MDLVADDVRRYPSITHELLARGLRLQRRANMLRMSSESGCALPRKFPEALPACDDGSH